MRMRKAMEALRRTFSASAVWRRRGLTWGSVSVLYSGAFTLFSLALAGILGPEEFGLFSYAQSATLLIGGFLGTLLLEPSVTVGATYPESEQPEYLSYLLLGHLIVGWGLAMPVIACLFYIRGAEHADLLISAGLLAPFLQVFHAGRRILYSQQRFGFLVALSWLHVIVLGAGLLFLYSSRSVSPLSGLVLSAIAGLIPTFILVVRAKAWRHRPSQQQATRYTRDHWRYARWTVLSVFPHWLSTAGMIPVAVWAYSLEVGSVYRVGQIFVSPIMQLSQVLAQIGLPFVSEKAARSERSYLRAVLRRSLGVFAALGSLGATSSIFAFYLFGGLFASTDHGSLAASILPALVVGTVLDVLRGPQTLTISASLRSEYLLVATLAGCFAMYASVAGFWHVLGPASLAYGFAIGRAVRLAVSTLLFLQWAKRHT